jgi:hypothetical protein
VILSCTIVRTLQIVQDVVLNGSHDGKALPRVTNAGGDDFQIWGIVNISKVRSLIADKEWSSILGIEWEVGADHRKKY